MSMASRQLPNSPGSSGGDERKRKRKRMLSNRESARRSRMRKQKHLDELIGQVTQIQEENNRLRTMIDASADLYINFASENNVLRAELSQLTDRLRCLNSVLEIASEVGALDVDIPAIPDTLLEPWQLPCPVQRLPASPQMFPC